MRDATVSVEDRRFRSHPGVDPIGLARAAKVRIERGRWTLRLLAGRMVELQHVDTLSHETVRQTLKKTRSSRI